MVDASTLAAVGPAYLRPWRPTSSRRGQVEGAMWTVHVVMLGDRFTCTVDIVGTSEPPQVCTTTLLPPLVTVPTMVPGVVEFVATVTQVDNRGTINIENHQYPSPATAVSASWHGAVTTGGVSGARS